MRIETILIGIDETGRAPQGRSHEHIESVLAQKHAAGGEQHMIAPSEDGSIVEVGRGGEREAGIAFGRPSCRGDSRKGAV